MGVCQSVYVPRRPVYDNLGCVVYVLRAQPRSSQMNLIHALWVVAYSMHGQGLMASAAFVMLPVSHGGNDPDGQVGGLADHSQYALLNRAQR